MYLMALLYSDTRADFVKYLDVSRAQVTQILKRRVIREHNIVGTVELTEN